MKIKKGKKFQFLLALSMVIGTVIGTGIFFKNQSIFQTTNGNPWLIIIGWLTGGTIALTTALSLVEVSSLSAKDNGGIAQYASELVGNRFGKFIRFNIATFNYTIFTFVIALFTTNFLFRLIHVKVETHVALVIVITLAFIVFFVALNIYAGHLVKKLQIYSTIIKVIPLIITSLIALISFFMVKDGSLWHTGGGDIEFTSKEAIAARDWSPLTTLFWILPATLFTFDGFLTASNVQGDLDDAKKIMPLAFGIGMSFVTALYLLNSIALINTGESTVERAIVKFFGGDPNHMATGYKVISSIISATIFISGVGCINGFSIAWYKSTKDYIQRVYKQKTFVERKVVLFMIVSFSMWILPFLIATLVTAKRGVGLSLFNSESDIFALLSFTKYGIVIAFAIPKHIKRTKMTRFYKWFMPVAIMAIIGIAIAVAYTVITAWIINPINAPNKLIGEIMPQWGYAAMGLMFVSLYVAVPFANEALIKHIRNKRKPMKASAK